MNETTEGTVAIVAALIVLFSAMWEPRVSIAVALIALAGLGLYKLVREHGRLK